MAAVVPEHRVPADADAGGEQPLRKPELLADGGDAFGQAFEVGETGSSWNHPAGGQAG